MFAAFCLDLSIGSSTMMKPEFETMAPPHKLALMEAVKSKWSQLRSDTQLVDTLVDLPVLTIAGEGRTAKSLFDPRNELFSSIFEDEPSMFPPQACCSDDWLALLTDIGLRNRVDQTAFLDCARK